VGARPWLASPINSALLIAFTPGSLSLGGIGFRVLTMPIILATWGVSDGKDYGSRPVLVNSSQHLISKITRGK
jgi:hypothetical protein